MGVLIDTCIRIDVEQGRLQPEQVSAVCGDRPVYLSPVTSTELRLGAELARNPALRQKRLRTWLPTENAVIEPGSRISGWPARRCSTDWNS